MHVISAFDLSLRLEMAIATLEEQGIPTNSIFAVPLEKGADEALFDSIHHSDGKGLFDGVALMGALLCALGTIYGFVLPWGPVIWGLIGFTGGSILGGIVKFVLLKVRQHRQHHSKTEVFLMVECKEPQIGLVKNILRNHGAYGLAVTD